MTAATSNSATAMETTARPWWMLLIQGSFAVLIGAILLWAPAKTKVETYQLLVALLGFFWLVSGILDLVHMFTDHTGWGWKLFAGLISIVAGSYILMYPVAAAVALPQIFVLVLGIWGLFYGFLALLMAFRGGGWGMGILGVITILFGFMLIGDYMNFGAGLAMLWAAAIWAVIGGIVMIVQAFRQRSA